MIFMMSRSMPQHISPQGGLGWRGLPQGGSREQGTRAYPNCVTQSNVLGCQGQCLNTSPLNPNKSAMCLQLAAKCIDYRIALGVAGQIILQLCNTAQRFRCRGQCLNTFRRRETWGGGPAGKPLGGEVPKASEFSPPPPAPHHRPTKTLLMCMCSCSMHSSSASSLALITDMHL